MEGGSSSGSASTVSEDDNMVVSSEDSSSPDETELELGLGLGIGLKGNKDSRVLSRGCCYTSMELSSSSSSSSPPSSSLSRANVAVGVKRTADSMSAANGQVVGWPPIRTYRMNTMVNQLKSIATEELNSGIQKNFKNSVATGSDIKVRNSLFVKVNMDGIPIGRKVDLNAHGCYESLAKTLEYMFLKPSMSANATSSSTREYKDIAEIQSTKLLDGSSEFVLTYEDKDGDWMLVGDVPWQMFLGSVKRLRIMRTSEATGITPMLHEPNGRPRSKPI